ncbi:uncharacterized protein K441DRAFT_677567 [Cenococcum geophilum 1.58]|uniref:uncharacterized protein n=1 Tax=Cenococcum geophilum 1.58 TaxID=794803 RepID=UPI00358FD764|nr:hypothetical protein K441DRAFT_677567 [Cenococcum geophilum 1.58]
MNFISNIISNSVAGFVEAGTRTAGGYAGDAIIRAGDLIESTGRGVGTSVENAATSYGDKLKGQGTITTTKAYLPKTPTPKTKAITSGKTSVIHPTTLQRSCSSPASSQAKKTAIIASKGADAASKPGSNPSTGQTALKKPTPYASTSTNVPKSNSTKPKPYPGTTTHPSKVDAPKPKPYPGTTTYPSKVDSSKPKPYPGTASNPSRIYASSASNPKPYPGTTTYPNSGKKTAVKPAKKPATPAKTEGTFRHI